MLVKAQTEDLLNTVYKLPDVSRRLVLEQRISANPRLLPRTHLSC